MASSEAVPRSTASVVTPRRVAGLTLVALFTVFAILNTVDTTVQLLFVEVTGPLWMTLLITFLLGAATAWLLVSRRRR